jgi:hypothetical protein
MLLRCSISGISSYAEASKNKWLPQSAAAICRGD